MKKHLASTGERLDSFVEEVLLVEDAFDVVQAASLLHYPLHPFQVEFIHCCGIGIIEGLLGSGDGRKDGNGRGNTAEFKAGMAVCHIDEVEFRLIAVDKLLATVEFEGAEALTTLVNQTGFGKEANTRKQLGVGTQFELDAAKLLGEGLSLGGNLFGKGLQHWSAKLFGKEGVICRGAIPFNDMGLFDA